MKKLLLILLITFSGSLFAQGKITEFNVGILGPKDAKTGFWGGLNMGRMVDENVGIGFSINVYRRSYTKETEIAERQQGQAEISIITTELDQSTTMIPLMFQVHYVGPVSPIFDLKVTAGIGYEFLWNSVTNFSTGEDNTRFFSSFGWQLSAGVSLPISRASDFFGEIFYHGGTPSRDSGKTEEGLPVRSEIDMSGIGFRIGLRIYDFGF